MTSTFASLNERMSASLAVRSVTRCVTREIGTTANGPAVPSVFSHRTLHQRFFEIERRQTRLYVNPGDADDADVGVEISKRIDRAGAGGDERFGDHFPANGNELDARPMGQGAQHRQTVCDDGRAKIRREMLRDLQRRGSTVDRDDLSVAHQRRGSATDHGLGRRRLLGASRVRGGDRRLRQRQGTAMHPMQ
jgi:hypothetical protein